VEAGRGLVRLRRQRGKQENENEGRRQSLHLSLRIYITHCT
jgi:hypothetical protein